MQIQAGNQPTPNIQKVVPVKKNGFVLELQVPPPGEISGQAVGQTFKQASGQMVQPQASNSNPVQASQSIGQDNAMSQIQQRMFNSQQLQASQRAQVTQEAEPQSSGMSLKNFFKF